MKLIHKSETLNKRTYFLKGESKNMTIQKTESETFKNTENQENQKYTIQKRHIGHTDISYPYG